MALQLTNCILQVLLTIGDYLHALCIHVSTYVSCMMHVVVPARNVAAWRLRDGLPSHAWKAGRWTNVRMQQLLKLSRISSFMGANRAYSHLTSTTPRKALHTILGLQAIDLQDKAYLGV
jgi:hypothetical protein